MMGALVRTANERRWGHLRGDILSDMGYLVQHTLKGRTISERLPHFASTWQTPSPMRRNAIPRISSLTTSTRDSKMNDTHQSSDRRKSRQSVNNISLTEGSSTIDDIGLFCLAPVHLQEPYLRREFEITTRSNNGRGITTYTTGDLEEEENEEELVHGRRKRKVAFMPSV